MPWREDSISVQTAWEDLMILSGCGVCSRRLTEDRGLSRSVVIRMGTMMLTDWEDGVFRGCRVFCDECWELRGEGRAIRVMAGEDSS